MNSTSLFLWLAISGAFSIAGAEQPSAVAFSESAESRFSLTVDSGLSQDSFEWTIAGDTQGRHPNILSELEWEKLQIIPASLSAEFKMFDHWRARLGGSYGWITDGENRDSDYAANNRQVEFSRSSAETSGRTLDAQFGLGYELPRLLKNVTLTPWIGVAYHQQKLIDQNGVQELDLIYRDLGPFSGLNSCYKSEWRGISLGLESRILLSDTRRIVLNSQYERVSYSASANWNLRTDFTGFHHHAEGNGYRLSLGYEWDPAPRWTLGIHARWSFFQTAAGIDQTNFTDGTHEKTRLNEVEWITLGIHASATYRF